MDYEKFYQEKQKINTIFYEGQIYDAYSLLIDILSTAKKEIMIIDNYAGKELLDILKREKIPEKIILKLFYVKFNNKITQEQVKTYYKNFLLVFIT